MKKAFLVFALLSAVFVNARENEGFSLRNYKSRSSNEKKELNFPFVIGADYTWSKARETGFFIGYTKGLISGGCGPAVISATSFGLSYYKPHNTTGRNYGGLFFQQDLLVVPTPILLAARADILYSPENNNTVFRPGVGISLLFLDFTFTYSFSNSKSYTEGGRALSAIPSAFPSGPGFTLRIKGFTGMSHWED